MIIMNPGIERKNIMGTKPCELCGSYSLDGDNILPSVSRIWLHHAFDTPGCRMVAVCQECVDQGAHDEDDEHAEECWECREAGRS